MKFQIKSITVKIEFYFFFFDIYESFKMTPCTTETRDVKITINTTEGKKFYEKLGTNPIPMPGQIIERDYWMLEWPLNSFLIDILFRMILTGQLKQLQLFWVDKRNPDKVLIGRTFTFWLVFQIFIQLTIEQERSGHTFVVKGYHFLSTVKVKYNILWLRLIHLLEVYCCTKKSMLCRIQNQSANCSSLTFTWYSNFQSLVCSLKYQFLIHSECNLV